MIMKKFLVMVAIYAMVLDIANAGEQNVGYLMNQKYVCINQGMIINKKLVPVMSHEDALRHPIRIMIDSHNKLQTDGPMKNLYSIGNNTYTDGTNKIKLFVVDDKRFMSLSSSKLKNVPILHVCVETDNWTVVR